MSIQRAETLKREWTDKCVSVVAGVAELRRFEGLVGYVKTVNMNCRLLVQFETPADISWYDIAPQFLTVVERTEAPTDTSESHDSVTESPKAPVPAKEAPAAQKAINPLDAIRKQNTALAASAGPVPAKATSPLDTIRQQAKSNVRVDDSTPEMAGAAPIASVSNDLPAPTEQTPLPSPAEKDAIASDVTDQTALPTTPAFAARVSSLPRWADPHPAAGNPIDQIREQASGEASKLSAVDSRFDQIRQQADSATVDDAADVAETQNTADGKIPAAVNTHVDDEAAGIDDETKGIEDPVKQTFRGKRLPKKDDLKIIEGIGPKIEELFRGDGIDTWEALSQAAPQRLQQILEDAGPRFRMHNPETWPAQAKLASLGDWQQLEQYQDLLDGGRPPAQQES